MCPYEFGSTYERMSLGAQTSAHASLGSHMSPHMSAQALIRVLEHMQAHIQAHIQVWEHIQGLVCAFPRDPTSKLELSMTFNMNLESYLEEVSNVSYRVDQVVWVFLQLLKLGEGVSGHCLI